MSLTGAEQLNNTGCWRAATHGAVRSCRAVARTSLFQARVSARHVVPPSYLAVPIVFVLTVAIRGFDSGFAESVP